MANILADKIVVEFTIEEIQAVVWALGSQSRSSCEIAGFPPDLSSELFRSLERFSRSVAL